MNPCKSEVFPFEGPDLRHRIRRRPFVPPLVSALNRNLRNLCNLRITKKSSTQRRDPCPQRNLIRVRLCPFAVLDRLYLRQSAFICGSGLLQIEVRYFFQG